MSQAAVAVVTLSEMGRQRVGDWHKKSHMNGIVIRGQAKPPSGGLTAWSIGPVAQQKKQDGAGGTMDSQVVRTRAAWGARCLIFDVFFFEMTTPTLSQEDLLEIADSGEQSNQHVHVLCFFTSLALTW